MIAIVSQLVFVLVIAIAIQSHASLYRVGEDVTGESYNDVWKRWMKRTFTIWVGVDPSGKAQLVFEADTGLGEAQVTVPYSSETVERLEQFLKTAIEWSSIAKNNNADTWKPLGCFPTFEHSICEQYGQAAGRGQMGLLFSARGEGRYTNLVISLIDNNNQFNKADIYLGPPQISAVLVNLHQLPTTMEKARRAASKQDLFKAPGPSTKTKTTEERNTETDKPARAGIGRELQAHSGVPSISPVETDLEILDMPPGAAAFWGRLRQRISSFWSAPPVDLAGKRYISVVGFRLHRNGTVSDVKVEQSSGNEYYDLAAQRAVQSASPFPALPANITAPHLDARFTFSAGEVAP